jgi:hypothetical protein
MPVALALGLMISKQLTKAILTENKILFLNMNSYPKITIWTYIFLGTCNRSKYPHTKMPPYYRILIDCYSNILEKTLRNTISLSLTIYSKILSSQCKLNRQIEPVQDKL